MPKTKDNYIKIIDLFTELKKGYPNRSIGQHISMAMSDYSDVWGVTDKEFLFALNKYAMELEFDLESESSVEKIIANSTNAKLFELEEEDDEDYGD